jgi:hypothetical protein
VCDTQSLFYFIIATKLRTSSWTIAGNKTEKQNKRNLKSKTAAKAKAKLVSKVAANVK